MNISAWMRVPSPQISSATGISTFSFANLNGYGIKYYCYLICISLTPSKVEHNCMFTVQLDLLSPNLIWPFFLLGYLYFYPFVSTFVQFRSSLASIQIISPVIISIFRVIFHCSTPFISSGLHLILCKWITFKNYVCLFLYSFLVLSWLINNLRDISVHIKPIISSFFPSINLGLIDCIELCKAASRSGSWVSTILKIIHLSFLTEIQFLLYIKQPQVLGSSSELSAVLSDLSLSQSKPKVLMCFSLVRRIIPH